MMQWLGDGGEMAGMIGELAAWTTGLGEVGRLLMPNECTELESAIAMQ